MKPQTLPPAEQPASIPKQPYCSPRLTVYGTVRTLTAAATGTFPESRRRSGDPTRLRIF